MLKSVKTVFAIASVVAISALSTSPASAMLSIEAGSLEQVYNCDTMSDGYGIGLWGGAGTVSLVNCDGYYLGDAEDSANSYTEDGTPDSSGSLLINDAAETLNFTGEADVVLLEFSGAGAFGAVVAREIYDMGDPSGVRIVDTSRTIELNPSEFTIGSQADAEAEVDINIDGDADCGIAAGQHIYAIQRVHVKTAGEFTFRVVGTDPVSGYIKIGNNSPLGDPMIALYAGEFDPAQADSSVEGCNDDFNDLTIDGFDWTIPNDQENVDHVYGETTDYKAIEGHFPVFTTNLEPGDYTMMVTTYSAVSASQWTSGSTPDESWEPGAGVIDYEVWGPENGLELVDHFELASTGVNAEFGIWAGLGLLGTGAVIAIARRRAIRA